MVEQTAKGDEASVEVSVPSTSAIAIAFVGALAKLLPGIAILLALWLFHADISEFLRRTRSFKGIGIELQAFDSNVRVRALDVDGPAVDPQPAVQHS